MRIGLLALILAVALGSATSAATGKNGTVEGARSFIVGVGDRTLAVLRSSTLSEQERTIAFGELLIEAVNFELLGRFALGRSGRRAKGCRFREFVQLFATHVIDLAAERFAEIEVESYRITKVRKMPNDDVIVSTEIRHGAGDPFEAGWRVRHRDGQYRINDLLVEGYSVGIHFRNTFERSVNRSLRGLVQKLRNKTSDSPVLAIAKRHVAPC